MPVASIAVGSSGLANAPANRRATHVLDRGNWDQPARPVEPHTPAVLHVLNRVAKPQPTRLDLAQWLVQEGIQSISLNPDTVIDTWQLLAKT